MRIRLAAALAVLVSIATLAGCQPPAAGPDESAAPGPARAEPAIYVYGFGDDADEPVEKLLESNVPELRFDNVGLEAAFKLLSETRPVNIQVNWGALDQLGITRSAEVTLALRDVSFRAALETLLAKAAGRQDVLDYIVRDGVIKVSTCEDLATLKFILVYDVDDLFEAIPTMDSERLLLLIRISVLPDTWAPTGDSIISEVNHLLVVKQTGPGHRDVRRFLELLRRATAARSGRAPLATVQKVARLDVVGIDALRGSPGAAAMLAANGFAITGESAEAMADLYDHKLPVLVTTDAMLHAYNVLFGESFKDFERKQADRFIAWQRGLWRRVSAARPQWITPEQMTRLRGLVAVGMKLADPAFDPGGVELPDWVEREVARATIAATTADSQAWMRTIAYATFQPRGIYAGDQKLERFFRARIWWSRYPLFAGEPGQLALAAEIGRLLAADRAAYSLLDEPYARMLGRSAGIDALALYDAAGAIVGRGRAVTPADLAKAAGQLARTSAPKIRTGDAAEELREPGSLPIYVLSSRYTFAGEVFTLTTRPPLGIYRLPGGLDLMAALGSDLARELDLAQTPAGVRDRLAEAIEQARKVRGDRLELIAAMIRQRDRVLGTLLSPELTDRHPPFMRSQAYPLKSLQTALAGWAESRHVWQLHAAESSGIFGVGIEESPSHPPAGIVEPNVQFWKQLIELVAGTRKTLGLYQPDEDRRWASLAEMAARCQAIAEAQLAGKELTDPQKQFFADFSEELSPFARTGGDGEHPGDPVVAFIHRGVWVSKAVHVGTGFPQAIYAICEHRGRKWLCKGGALVYREHVTDGLVLNDAAWLMMLRSRRAPPGPAWTEAFCPAAEPPPQE